MPDNILVVEDEPALRDTLIYNLKSDLDFLKEKRSQLLEESLNKNQGHLN